MRRLCLFPAPCTSDTLCPTLSVSRALSLSLTHTHTCLPTDARARWGGRRHPRALGSPGAAGGAAGGAHGTRGVRPHLRHPGGHRRRGLPVQRRRAAHLPQGPSAVDAAQPAAAEPRHRGLLGGDARDAVHVRGLRHAALGLRRGHVRRLRLLHGAHGHHVNHHADGAVLRALPHDLAALRRGRGGRPQQARRRRARGRRLALTIWPHRAAPLRLGPVHARGRQRQLLRQLGDSGPQLRQLHRLPVRLRPRGPRAGDGLVLRQHHVHHPIQREPPGPGDQGAAPDRLHGVRHGGVLHAGLVAVRRLLAVGRVRRPQRHQPRLGRRARHLRQELRLLQPLHLRGPQHAVQGFVEAHVGPQLVRDVAGGGRRALRARRDGGDVHPADDGGLRLAGDPAASAQHAAPAVPAAAQAGAAAAAGQTDPDPAQGDPAGGAEAVAGGAAAGEGAGAAPARAGPPAGEAGPAGGEAAPQGGQPAPAAAAAAQRQVPPGLPGRARHRPQEQHRALGEDGRQRDAARRPGAAGAVLRQAGPGGPDPAAAAPQEEGEQEEPEGGDAGGAQPGRPVRVLRQPGHRGVRGGDPGPGQRRPRRLPGPPGAAHRVGAVAPGPAGPSGPSGAASDCGRRGYSMLYAHCL
ncbi:hypothetical protein ONE63_001903 [Megalurothrips usitatus]|uniref:Uncharacterized protein n=1 Tax=Megalurothrips usitatus TaxID=439358 RepID=A0AAV7XCZ0_9NEOP|nr:hypothetical protein ONE63_001903 [Megalurothrips usitatus]